jgi:2-polyprenyl-3-methyl-5-hydroxy-6-metoxy-1,4-benzoquinol methylase
MENLLVPRRRRGVEILDDPAVDPRLVRRSLHDVARSNLLFGGTRAVVAELRRTLGQYERSPSSSRELTLLDVGTGIGDIPSGAQRAAQAFGVRLTTIGLDESEILANDSRARTSESICGSALALPVADHSVDIATCSQVLHHFADDDARQVIRELHRVARVRVIVSDIRRSWLAAGGIWLASFPLGFHPVSRHDGVVSVMRGFTATELSGIVTGAVGRTPTVRRRIGFRITASWTPETH